MSKPRICNSLHIQTVIPEYTHRVLRDIAYEKRMPLRELIRNLLINCAVDFEQQKVA